ncbi:MAG: hypothetical protein A2445_01370 [Candidatus Jacksonbacteria bacterium RIFOXYC2_FULL_44_29]|nr:MAG: hypothetical protein A2295_02185 [Candidatus Jacksonbacteria bacterium RIFOXYB2_FULL_44_15]OGY76554.1 MAG: hypothetical protein A2240_03810 [Candidatus Jacksonbacteria bacterium RIFOXYA2_FULL_43_12]OGY78520.1 MAG: hypothetical protein A2445_01370 [Candidatus Jacksonbacteria bacterium RIFOXYC2_FULL_44_29]OGY81176.1 MAG: hypothetical protein A2550_01765 [Candidatus Jacksonbacteria bacterium RIFOXYD2_FULL_43_21]HBH45779.1 hypothetical protein [Candidatus Jacksonbacteria bacterium]
MQNKPLIIIITLIALFGLGVGYWYFKGAKNSTLDSPGVCSLENCHGLDIKCGPNPPQVCTESYMVGDRCLQYAKCGVQNGQCRQIENSQFTQCKLCIQICVDANKADNIKLFDCASKCN